ncbi:hypothetical protein D3C72_1797960 [compost metagenome]
MGDILGRAIAIGSTGCKLATLACCQRHGRYRDGEPTGIEGGTGHLQRRSVAGHVLELGRNDGIPFIEGGRLTIQVDGGYVDVRTIPVDLTGEILR